MRHEENALLGGEANRNLASLVFAVIRILERDRHGVEEYRGRF